MDTKKLKATVDTFIDTKVVPMPTNTKVAIVAALFLLPLALFYFLLYTPKAEEIARLEGSAAQLRTELNEVKAKAAKLEEHKVEMAQVEEKFKEASLLIPDQKEIPSLLDSISGLGSSAGLDILSFVPGGEAPKDFYAEIPVALSVSGTYHKVGYFLDTVSKLPRIVNVTKVSMGAPKLIDGEMMIDAKLDLVTYKFIPVSNAAPAQKKAKP